MELIAVREANVIRTKILVGNADKTERQKFLYYVGILEAELDEVCGESWEADVREKYKTD